jgi:hypothetical protein
MLAGSDVVSRSSIPAPTVSSRWPDSSPTTSAAAA